MLGRETLQLSATRHNAAAGCNLHFPVCWHGDKPGRYSTLRRVSCILPVVVRGIRHAVVEAV